MSEIEHLRAVGRAATEGPWRVVYGNEIHAGGQREVVSAEMDDDSMYGPSASLRLRDADADFCATARNEWDGLLDEVELLRAKVAAVEALAEMLEVERPSSSAWRGAYRNNARRLRAALGVDAARVAGGAA